MEADSAKLKELAVAAGAETWEDRQKNQKPQCKFGEDGVCCRICSMGPCRITPKASRGICGADADAIAGRNYLRMVAGGCSAHSDHGREICHTLYAAKADGNYKIKDEKKLIALADEWGIAHEGRDIYDVARDVALCGLNEYGKPFGTQLFLKRATEERRHVWQAQELEPRAVDREITTCMHMTHMGNTADAEALVRQSLRTGLATAGAAR
jgi:carbon-monoxide dehydrogenase catalytic subunit